ncbi:PREDICTED: uncharacterized protein LOC109242782 [Nicotiana attenuata]|uniref:uncharacterized protein LOC109242782 n=1 Tax=Nicotiana attenuata TaxID=49451 RepID=UPI0009050317|nr:PREDICTED: uncharacterized protein LOC109242782 [Nicotiana attenuata]
MSTIQNTPLTVVDGFLLQLQMWWYDLGEDGQKWVTKYLGALTDILKVKGDGLIEALVTFWDPVHNVFRFSDFELTPTLEEIAGFSGFGRDLRKQKLIFPKAPSVHRFFGLLNISNQIRKNNVVNGCCSFYFLYSRFGKPDGFEIHEKGLSNKQNKDTWQIHRRFAFIVAFLGIMVFPNKERTIDIRIARAVQVLTTKEHHTLAPIILSDIYRALTLCKSGAKFFEGCNILLQMWLIEHLRHHPKFMRYGPSKDNVIESYEERIKDYNSPEGVKARLRAQLESALDREGHIREIAITRQQQLQDRDQNFQAFREQVHDLVVYTAQSYVNCQGMDYEDFLKHAPTFARHLAAELERMYRTLGGQPGQAPP